MAKHTIVASSKIAARRLSSSVPVGPLLCLSVDDLLAVVRFCFTYK